ncbi:MAG: exopolyphosphatase [Bacteroidetes bacterium]|jgi:exopolyphosphatase/guanosine-5'-triphosphate,3'-diphosphate pyrophosphatase|nr:exopolyphosphatase [Bacteroidota bacterium]HMT34585.1 exopolyphosphatase [Chitinophagaceae bacterium]MBK6818626.1 exopolyphosphatase [Bacteroidota bacterium]MBK7040158.1 exopolyphosphatase [Bacteroidota bacterium]MBK7586980.1 exopolyphosphatase [Bacteroidota bacterium]
MRLAAIDIGSNAARLLIKDITTYIDGTLDFTKVNLVRVPLRLGFDVFESGSISDIKIQQLIETIQAFKHFLNIYEVQAIKVCATSAMRDAKNASEIVQQVFKETAIKINVISGSEEAQILYETHLADNLDAKFNYLYIDVGGGSTELTLYTKAKEVIKKSFNIGTIRLLKDKVEEEAWDEMKNFIKTVLKAHLPAQAIGSGGNINKIFSLSKRKLGKPLPVEILRDYYKEMNALSVNERMHKYGFRQDRADVIVPALLIYNNIMRWADIQEIYVPQIGLADGLIRLLYNEMSFTSMMGIAKK